MLSRGKENFHYEKKLPTTIGGKANLDGFYEDNNRYIFVEAKCHEPYTVKKTIVSTSYASLYDYINERMMGNLRIEMKVNACGRHMSVDYFADNEKLERFDLKQMICHLLGIATGLLSGTLERKQTDFIYLLYDPTELDLESDARVEIERIYARTCHECNLLDFAELFRVILEFLIKSKFQGVVSGAEVNNIIMKFTFTLVSQDSYPLLIQ